MNMVIARQPDGTVLGYFTIPDDVDPDDVTVTIEVLP